MIENLLGYYRVVWASGACPYRENALLLLFLCVQSRWDGVCVGGEFRAQPQQRVDPDLRISVSHHSVSHQAGTGPLKQRQAFQPNRIEMNDGSSSSLSSSSSLVHWIDAY